MKIIFPKIIIDASHNKVLTAEITVDLASVENLNAHPLLSFESISDAARAYGYVLVPFK